MWNLLSGKLYLESGARFPAAAPNHPETFLARQGPEPCNLLGPKGSGFSVLCETLVGNAPRLSLGLFVAKFFPGIVL